MQLECDSSNTLTLLLLQTFSDGFSFTKVPMLLLPLRMILITKFKFLSCASHSLSFSPVRSPPVLSTCYCFPMFIGKETETKTDKGHITSKMSDSKSINQKCIFCDFFLSYRTVMCLLHFYLTLCTIKSHTTPSMVSSTMNNESFIRSVPWCE